MDARTCSSVTCLSKSRARVHARRPFIKAEDAIPKAARSQDQVASRCVQLIAKLYRAEALTKDWAPERRVRLRSRYSRAVVREFERLLLANLHCVAPSSLLGETLHYLHGQWPKLVRFLDSGRATGLQPRGERHPAVRRRKTQLAVRRYRGRCQRQR